MVLGVNTQPAPSNHPKSHGRQPGARFNGVQFYRLQHLHSNEVHVLMIIPVSQTWRPLSETHFLLFVLFWRKQTAAPPKKDAINTVGTLCDFDAGLPAWVVCRVSRATEANVAAAWHEADTCWSAMSCSGQKKSVTRLDSRRQIPTGILPNLLKIKHF